jgi:uncharacterized protein
MHPILDPYFYAVAIPAVVLAGLSKGGFGGSIGMLAVPMLALVISPIQAAGIMLPILVAMDIVGLIAYRGHADRRSLMILLPAAVAGIGLGWATAAIVNEAFVRLLVGVISVVFVADHLIKHHRAREAQQHSVVKGSFWGAIAGFTSFVSHTGGPPYQLYMVPLRLAPTLLAGTTVIFFFTVNALKLIPYFFLGQFDTTNLATSAALLPLAPLATLAGVKLVRTVNQQVFYGVIYSAMAVIGIKLIWDGAFALL